MMKKLPSLLLLSLFGAIFFAPEAEAQLTIRMKPTRKMYVSHEPVKVDLTITNRAGRDVVLSGKGKTPWLTFQIKNSRGHLISPRGNTEFKPVIVPAGKSLKRTITVNTMYPMSDLGLYRVTASVFFTQLDRFFNSTPASIQVSDGKKLWSQVVGVPSGREGAGTYRRYTLLSFNSGAEKLLYMRLQDERTGIVRATFSLGEVIMIRQPQWTIDTTNRLHLLHMGAPQTYVHSVVDVDGKILSRETYRSEGAVRPKLVSIGSGDVTVQGGVSESEEKASPLLKEVRKLSERPKNFPKVPTPGGDFGR